MDLGEGTESFPALNFINNELHFLFVIAGISEKQTPRCQDFCAGSPLEPVCGNSPCCGGEARVATTAGLGCTCRDECVLQPAYIGFTGQHDAHLFTASGLDASVLVGMGHL